MPTAAPLLSPRPPPFHLSPRVKGVRVVVVAQQAHVLAQREQSGARALDLVDEPVRRARARPQLVDRLGGGCVVVAVMVVLVVALLALVCFCGC